MKKVIIDLQNDKYQVYIGDCISYLKEFINNQKVLFITDENVKGLYLDTLKKIINIDYIFTLGKNPEACKNLVYYEKCVKYALENYIDKKIIVLAFGGGAVTDFAGFFASTYKRGIDFISLPTTLLSHDSAVGGKTALNIGNTKNVIGSFYQPKVVLFHLPFLKSLSKSDILSGFGEIFKHDFLDSGYLFQEIFYKQKLLTHLIDNETLLEEIIYRAILVKKVYIEMDLFDSKGKRQFLNLGHTLGHALEITNNLSHGEAISLGMCFSLFLSSNPFYLPFYEKLISWGYFQNNIDFNLEDIIKLIKNDKKNISGKIKFIGLKEFGNPYEIVLTIDEFQNKLKEFLRLFK